MLWYGGDASESYALACSSHPSTIRSSLPRSIRLSRTHDYCVDSWAQHLAEATLRALAARVRVFTSRVGMIYGIYRDCRTYT